MSAFDLPTLGAGIGLRRAHFDALERLDAPLDWLEFTPENYMASGGKPLRALEMARERWPLVPHGVALNLGGGSPLDDDYLRRLRTIVDQVDAPWFSDHLCWSGVEGRQLYELLPLPYTWEAVDHVAKRIQQVRRLIGRPMLIEDISYYAELPGAQMDEADFLCAVLEAADCGLLLDVNNVYVNARNHGFDPIAYLRRLPLERVVQVHVAGHDDSGPMLIDTHGAEVRLEVWALLRWLIERTGPTSVLLERDANVPPLPEVLAEAEQARAVLIEQGGWTPTSRPADIMRRSVNAAH